MSRSCVNTVALNGVEAVEVAVQIHIGSGLPAFHIVGLANKSVSESKERIRAALTAIGLKLPSKRITVNLSPADLPKSGSHYDLPIIAGILIAMGALPSDVSDEYFFIGELSLDGKLHRVPGVLPTALLASSKNMGIVCPNCCGSEAAWADEKLDIVAPISLLALVNHFKGTQIIARPQPRLPQQAKYDTDMSDIKGQESAKRAMEIAAAGFHCIALIGPPGSGKSMLAQRLITILPPMTPVEALEVTIIYSVAGMLKNSELICQRVFRDPHHTCSLIALAGGGTRARPGELSLAHRGVLFLDELPEFSRSSLEVLRQPLETGNITVSRASAHVTYPARFQLVAAMNPCKCGYMSDQELACKRAPKCGKEYLSRISGPLMDRIDIVCEIEAVDPQIYINYQPSESSTPIRKRVFTARSFAKNRWKKQNRQKQFYNNAELPAEKLKDYINTSAEADNLLLQAAKKMRFSARGMSKIMKVSRTIADLEQVAEVARHHMAEAISYRHWLGDNL